MKRKICLFLLLVLVMVAGNAAFANIPDEVHVASSLDGNQKVLFQFLNPFPPEYIWDLDYDIVNQELYMLSNPQQMLQSIERDFFSPLYTQFVYSSNGDLVPSDQILYPGDLGPRMGIEFDKETAWTLNMMGGDMPAIAIQEYGTIERTGFAVCYANAFSARNGRFIFGTRQENGIYWDIFFGEGDLSNQENYEIKLDGTFLYQEHMIEPEGPEDVEYVRAFGLSPDGDDLFYAGVYMPLLETLPTMHNVIRMNLIDHTIMSWFSIVQKNPGELIESYDLYVTDNAIVVLWQNDSLRQGFIQRYSYDGELIDEVEVDPSVRRITEGPEGSTIYVRLAPPEVALVLRTPGLPYEAIQITWPHAQQSDSCLTGSGGMKPVIRERTRSEQTIARFIDHQFGLLRVEEPETGIVDYQAPIKSSENLVKLQIPYCDIKAKFESGARNLLVEYQGQELVFPMDLFDCDDMLASMPCQSDATVEIIMHTDEAGNVTYEIQLFVVEQVNVMTRVVHRKTIQ